MNRILFSLTAFLAAVMLQGCVVAPTEPDESLYIRRGKGDRVVIQGGSASVESQAARPAAPTAPETAWFRSDGSVAAKGPCRRGNKWKVRHPQWPGWIEELECRVVSAPSSQAPAAEVAPAPAAPAPAYAPAPTTTASAGSCGAALQARGTAALGVRPEPVAQCLVTADSSRHTCSDGQPGKALKSAADTKETFVYWDCSPGRNLR